MINPIENRQPEITKALENLEKFRLNKMDLINGDKATLASEARMRLFYLFIIFTVLAALSYMYVWLSPLFLLCFIVLLFLILNSTNAESNMHANVYQQVAKKDLIEAIYPNINYSRSGEQFNKKIETSPLLEHDTSIRDHFHGTAKNGSSFEFAEVESTNKNTPTFKGFFFTIKSPDLSCERIIILKKSLLKHTNLEGLTRVNLQGAFPEFEANYAVFSRYKSEAEKLLTADFLKPIYELSQKWNGDIRWSFIGDQIDVVLNTGKDLLDAPMVFRGVYVNNWAKNFCDSAVRYVDAIEEISSQLEQVSEKVKIEIKEERADRMKPLEDGQNSAYDHLIE